MAKMFLYPISWIFGTVTYFRNKLFDYKILKSKEFDLPVISIGNITVGGTGKTPHTEYLIDLLKEEFKVATLSRGYKRKTKGFVLAGNHSKSTSIGDEPLQIKTKFPDIQVAVDEKRVRGIQNLLKFKKDIKPDVILLDDAFQHRYVKPGLNILLIDYNRPISEDKLLPAGSLRESSQGINRANIVIMTKCPEKIQPIQRRIISKEINLRPYQNLFFTTLEYGKLQPAFQGNAKQIDAFYTEQAYSVLLVTGIANPKPIRDYITPFAKRIEEISYPDHHHFTQKDMTNIAQKLDTMDGSRKIIITTEKDVMRIRDMEVDGAISSSLFYLPIRIKFLDSEGKQFDKKILNYVRENKSNFELHTRTNKL
ncbi:tetraacyldisaccharide 4'-kinase [Puteibacter caeruleilacunae]|nr:tetraacyldisaccharide 4'-kinase [Puteibacter caeruleilacunae]